MLRLTALVSPLTAVSMKGKFLFPDPGALLDVDPVPHWLKSGCLLGVMAGERPNPEEGVSPPIDPGSRAGPEPLKEPIP